MTEQIRIWWIDSTSDGVFEYIIYRDNVEIGRIIFGNTPEFFDSNINFSTNYKYVVQAVNNAGISTGEVLNVNLTNITTTTQELVINTTSTSPTWSPVSVINSGHPLHWTVSGGVVIPEVIANIPVFDMSGNTGTAVVTITSITEFKGLTELIIDYLEVVSLDVLKATELVSLSCKGDYALETLDVSTLVNLEDLTFRSQNLTNIDLTNNINLIRLWGYSNFLTSIDLSNNVNLLLIYLYTNDLDSSFLDSMVNDLDSHGLSSGDLKIVSNSGNLTESSQPSYNNLIEKNWSIDVAAPPFTNNTVLEMVNFNVVGGLEDRVYFGTTKAAYTSDINITGFKIEGRTINSITINNGSFSGHYFTLASSLNFWDNILIRLEGSTSNVYDFTLQYINNTISEPSTSKNYYVATNGNDSNNGTSINTPWKTIYRAAQVVTNGSTVWIKAGIYTEKPVVLNAGLIDQPIKFIGYRNIPGDAILLDREAMRITALATLSRLTFDETAMPLLTGASSFTNHKNYIIVKNIQIYTSLSGNDTPCFNMEDSSNNYMYNCYSDGAGSGIRNTDVEAYNNRFERCMSGNHTGFAFRLSNRNHLYDDMYACTTKSTGQDYYLCFFPGSDGHSVCVRNSKAIRYDLDSHTGHGITFRGANNISDNPLDPTLYPYDLRYCLAENSTVVNMANGGMEFRRSTSHHNVARNVTFLSTNETTLIRSIQFLHGTYGNTVENCYIDGGSIIGINGARGIYLYTWSYEDPTFAYGGKDNVVKNTIFKNLRHFIVTHQNTDTDGAIPPEQNTNNQIINCTLWNVDRLVYDHFEVGGVFKETNGFTNCILDDVPIKETDNGFVMNNNDFWNSFTTPDDVNNVDNIDANPLFVDTEDYIPTNLALNAGLIVSGVNYDRYGVERSKSVVVPEQLTIGVAEINKV